MGDTAHVAAVIGRARAVALVGGGRANRGELIGVSRIAATGTSARHGASALVVALVVTARTSDSAEQRLQDQQEKNSQGQECAGYHLHWQPPFSARARDARPKTRGEIALVLDKLQYRNAPKSGERPSRASDAPHSRRRGSHNALRVAMCSSDPLPGVDGRQDAERGHQDGGVRRLPAGEPVSLTHLHTFGDLERPGGLLARAEVARRAGQGRHPRARGRRRSARAAAARETGGGSRVVMVVPRGRSSAGGGRRTRYRLAALCKRHRAALIRAERRSTFAPLTGSLTRRVAVHRRPQVAQPGSLLQMPILMARNPGGSVGSRQRCPRASQVGSPWSIVALPHSAERKLYRRMVLS